MLIPFIDDLNKKIPYKDSATFEEQKVAIEKQISFLQPSLKKRNREIESDNGSETPSSKKSKIDNK